MDLLELADLERWVAAKSALVAAAERDFDVAQKRFKPLHRKRAFVVRPFAPEFQDVYILGIRDVAARGRTRDDRVTRRTGMYRSQVRLRQLECPEDAATVLGRSVKNMLPVAARSDRVHGFSPGCRLSG
jgi:hypothetical protein